MRKEIAAAGLASKMLADQMCGHPHDHADDEIKRPAVWETVDRCIQQATTSTTIYPGATKFALVGMAVRKAAPIIPVIANRL
ncbi:MAG: hypothetical protein WD648_14085 [Planctomycetaceae bacterium]